MEPDEEGRGGAPGARDTRRVVRRAAVLEATPRRDVHPAPTVVPAGALPVPWRRGPVVDDASTGGAPHRLRDLGPGGRAVALALVVLLVLPGVVGLLRLAGDGWVIHSDNALLTLRSRDVTAGHPPLVGQPSTSEQAGGGVLVHHPGPIQMWAFAPLARLFGGWGFVVGGVIVNLGAVLTGAWVVFRRLGPAGGLVGAALFGLLLRSTEVYLLTDPVSSNMWGLAVVAVALGAWAVADGDHRLLPMTAAWATWAGQQHLAAVGPTAALALVAVVGFLVGRWRDRRAGTTAPDTPWRWFLGAGLVSLVLWAPVIVQQVTGDPGNITAVVDYAGASGRTTFGVADALHIAVRSLEPVPILLRTHVQGPELVADPSLLGWVVAAVTLLAAAAVVVLPGFARRARLLVVAGLAVAPAGVFNAANMPGNTVEVLRLNLHRWVWPFSSLVVVGVVWAVADLLVRRAEARGTASSARERVGALAAGRGPVAAVGVTALFVLVTIVQPQADDPTRDPYSSQLVRTVDDLVIADVGDADRVLLIPFAPAAELSVVPALTLQLTEAGVDVEVPERLAPFFGDRAASDDWDVAYVLTAGSSRPPILPGRVVADVVVDGRLAAPVERLAAALRGTAPRLNAVGEADLASLEPDPTRALDVALTIQAMGDDPVSALLDPRVVDLLADGIDGVIVDQSARAELADLLADQREVWLARRFFVYRVEAGEVAHLLALTVPDP